MPAPAKLPWVYYCHMPSAPPPLHLHPRYPPDASIWLFQFMKAMRDDKGDMMRNAHLLGFFRRICRWDCDHRRLSTLADCFRLFKNPPVAPTG